MTARMMNALLMLPTDTDLRFVRPLPTETPDRALADELYAHDPAIDMWDAVHYARTVLGPDPDPRIVASMACEGSPFSSGAC